ncbi:MAG: prenyltransferase/squalene oxidase repeat-containing protein [Candidatus Micrarchaeota archaeon]
MQKNIAAVLIFAVLLNSIHAVDVPLALEFIKAKQLPNGAFDSFSSPHSPSAVLALHAFEADSPNLTNGLAFLKSDLEDDNSYAWGEADLIGLSLYAYARAGNLSDLNPTGIIPRLIAMQGENGGFKGYSQCLENCSDPDWTVQVWGATEDSISTSAALMGLIASGYIDETLKNSSLLYLASLKNSDGSYNLTHEIKLGSFWSLAPDAYSQTAFVLWALNKAGKTEADVVDSLAYLETAVQMNFNDRNRTYAAALASIAFATYNRTNSSIYSLENLRCSQNSDGGFRDSSRMATGSNVMDTAFALLAIGNNMALNCSSSGMGNSTNSSNSTPSVSPSPSPSTSPTETISPSPTTSSSSSSSNNYYYQQQYEYPSASPTPSPKVTPSPSPSALKKIIADAPSPTPQPTPSPSATVKNQTAETTPSPTEMGKRDDKAPPTGFFVGANMQNMAYAGIIFIALGLVFMGFKSGVFK